MPCKSSLPLYDCTLALSHGHAPTVHLLSVLSVSWDDFKSPKTPIKLTIKPWYYFGRTHCSYCSEQKLRLIDGSTAELATGVTLTCVPTLPSLYKRRKSKPSTRVTIGSKRSRSTQLTSTDNDPTIVEADYFELKGRDGGKRHTRMPATAFVNEITGGEGDSDHSVESLDTTRGIMRVVKIEQSKV